MCRVTGPAPDLSLVLPLFHLCEYLSLAFLTRCFTFLLTFFVKDTRPTARPPWRVGGLGVQENPSHVARAWSCNWSFRPFSLFVTLLFRVVLTLIFVVSCVTASPSIYLSFTPCSS